MEINVNIIARIHTDFKEKFGIPRQSGLCSTKAVIEFEPRYRDNLTVRGLEDFSHIWLIWQFSENVQKEYTPTVRPPRLGGNTRMGVFATRSPFRPNPLGLSCVKLIKIDTECENAPLIYVEGADMLDGTPIYDIKPYLPHADCIPDASGGFSTDVVDNDIEVIIPDGIECDRLCEIKQLLSQDPRPAYHNDERMYGMSYGGYEISFHVKDGKLYVDKITEKKN